MHNQKNTPLFGNVQNILFHLTLTEWSVFPLTLFWVQSNFQVTKNKNRTKVEANVQTLSISFSLSQNSPRFSVTNNLCYKWLPSEITRYLSRPFAPFLCAEREKSRSDQEINFCQQFPEVRLINKCRHGISYSLFKEIETEFALKVINEQTLNRVLNPDECNPPNNPHVALILVECTFSGTGWIWSLY